MSAIARALRISRPHLVATRDGPMGPPRGSQCRTGDAELLARIRKVVRNRATYGYRRVTARLNRQESHERVNPKRIYRLMQRAGLLLPKYPGKPQRPHEGRIITLKSNLRWCSDAFELRCWNGERVQVAFSLDCCDREAIGWVATSGYIDGGDIRDLMAMTIEARFAATRTPHPIEWLTDNGPPYTAHETRDFGKDCGLLIRNTPSYSPESNGMAEAFVKTFKRDYAYLADLEDAESVIRQLPAWFADYNENHPHKGLKMLSPNQFRRMKTH